MYKQIVEFFKGKNIAIIGFGREGKSTYKFIRNYLSDEVITILDGNTKLFENNEFLKDDKNLKVVLGDNYLDDLNDFDVIMKSPGVKLGNKCDNVKDKITSQHALAFKYFKNQIIGITGTKGKSTTTSLIYKVLKDQGIDTYLLGNIGVPIFDYISSVKEDSMMAIECSAYQTEYIKDAPHISIILNLFEEHLDYFENPEAYFLSKLNMFKYQDSSDYALYSSKNKTLYTYINKLPIKSNLIDIDSDMVIKNDMVCFNGKELYDVNSKRLLIGNNQLEDILFVLRVGLLLDIDTNKMINSINTFTPLEHRLEYVGTFGEVKYYNDSIATIPDATINCIETLKDVDTIIFGGMDRGIDYTPLIEFFNKSKIENFICLKDTGYKIGKLIKRGNIYYASDLKDAVSYAKKVTKKICVMSPAAPSYNEYKNFEEKGKLYKEYVRSEEVN